MELEEEIVKKVNNFGKNLFEESLRYVFLHLNLIFLKIFRVMVLCAQVQAQLWRRNGFSLINQIHNYYSPICRVEMYDKDLLMMQVAAVLNDPKELLIHILTRWALC